MHTLLEEPQFDDVAIIMVSVNNSKLEVTPMGGQFNLHHRDIGVEAYRLLQHLLDASAKYGGAQYTPTGGITMISPREKH